MMTDGHLAKVFGAVDVQKSLRKVLEFLLILRLRHAVCGVEADRFERSLREGGVWEFVKCF